jgi:hypothetical protein
MWPFDKKEKPASEIPAYAQLKAPDVFKMRGRIIELSAKHNALLERLDSLTKDFDEYPPPHSFFVYTEELWVLVQELFDALLELDMKSRSWVEERNKMIEQARKLNSEVLELRKLQRPAIARLKQMAKKKR